MAMKKILAPVNTFPWGRRFFGRACQLLLMEFVRSQDHGKQNMMDCWFREG